MAADTEHALAVIARDERNQRRLAQALARLDQDILQYMSNAPLRDGQLFDLEWAISARAEIAGLVRQRYINEIDGIIQDFAEVAAEAQAMLGTYTDFVQLDQAAVRQLQQLTFNGFETLGDEFIEEVANQVYKNTLTGASFADSVAQIRASVDADLGRYAQVALHDTLMDFDRSITINMSLEAGAERFKYYGPDDSKTRPHCDKYVGKTLTIDEINEAWSGEWSGKRSGSPFVVAGGYNCRHRFRPVF
jgi:hypothetical protein